MNPRFQRNAGTTPHPRPRAVTPLFLLGAILCVAWVHLSSAAEPHEQRRVLLINSLGREFAPWDAFSGDLRTELQRRFSHGPDIFEVSLESARFGIGQQEPVVRYIENLFEDRSLDLIITIGGPAVRFAQAHRARLFPDVPMLMTAVDQRHIQPASLTSKDAVLAVWNEPVRVIEDLLHLLPQTTNLAVVIGTSPLEQFWRETLQSELRPFTNRLAIEWWHELSFPEMVKRSAALPPRSAIFYAVLMVDAAGNTHVQQRALKRLSANTAAPIFGLHSTQLGEGIVGGPLMSIEQLSWNAAEVAERILRGETPSDIQFPVQEAERPRFDWRQLQRWDIDEARLPPGSAVLFRRPTMWQQYRNRIIGIAAVVFVQTAIISYLLANLLRRRRAERSLAESEARFQVAANASPVIIWMAGADKRVTFLNKRWLEFTGRTLEQETGDGWIEGIHPDDALACLKTYHESFDARREFAMEYRLRNRNGEYGWILDTGAPRFVAGTFVGYVGSATDITALKLAEERWRVVVESAPDAMLVVNAAGEITHANARVEAVFNFERAELVGQSVEILIPERLRARYSALRDQYWADPPTSSMRETEEVFGLRKDGSKVPLEIGLSPIRMPEGRFLLISMTDITERLAAEAKLRENDQRMTLAADAANLGMWVWDAPDPFIWASPKWRAIHGYAPNEEIRYDALVERLHPEDRDMVAEAIAEGFNQRGAFHVQHRVSLPDKTTRWISTSGRVEERPERSTLRLMGISIDITERMQIEEAAREVSAKFITAQEDERRRIARDLHDDLNQRLAMLSVQIDLLAHLAIPAEARTIIADIASHVHDLSSEVHKLSYQLHPAKLDQLGLVAAARSFCQEVSKQCRLPVEFVHEDVPRELADMVALSLYRIIQEALQNIIKHSGASRARVELRGHADFIELKVSDDGRGFHIDTLGHQAGLGLLGMRERVRLMHGHIIFHSSPNEGTRIEVSVPQAGRETAAA